MPQPRAVARNPLCSSAIMIVQAAMPDGAAAELFKDSFGGDDAQLEGPNTRGLQAARSRGNP